MMMILMTLMISNDDGPGFHCWSPLLLVCVSRCSTALVAAGLP